MRGAVRMIGHAIMRAGMAGRFMMALISISIMAEQRTKTSGTRRRADGAIKHRDHKHCRDKLYTHGSYANHSSRMDYTLLLGQPATAENFSLTAKGISRFAQGSGQAGKR